LNLRDWKLCVSAMFLAVAVAITAWVERAALLLIIGGALIALGFVNWRTQGQSARLAGVTQPCRILNGRDGAERGIRDRSGG
jgi:hypothetical protein